MPVIEITQEVYDELESERRSDEDFGVLLSRMLREYRTVVAPVMMEVSRSEIDAAVQDALRDIVEHSDVVGGERDVTVNVNAAAVADEAAVRVRESVSRRGGK